MFTGIVQAKGSVVRIMEQDESQFYQIVIDIGHKEAQDVEIGHSIAVNGVCLTVFNSDSSNLYFQLSSETLSRTNLGKLRVNDIVNIEKAATLKSFIGGHLVQGHADCVGKLIERSNHMIQILVPIEYRRYLIPKGYVAVDGASLTVCDLRVSENCVTFWIALIPHTESSIVINQEMNIEFDMMGKYILNK